MRLKRDDACDAGRRDVLSVIPAEPKPDVRQARWPNVGFWLKTKSCLELVEAQPARTILPSPR